MSAQELQDAMFANNEAGMPVCVNETDHHWMGSYGKVICAICLETRGDEGPPPTISRETALLMLRKVSLDLISLAEIIDEVKPCEVETFGGDEFESDVIAANIRMCAGHAQILHDAIDRVF